MTKIVKSQEQATDEKMSVEVYCVINGEQKIVGQMMAMKLSQKNDPVTEKTVVEWDALRDETMNEVAK